MQLPCNFKQHFQTASNCHLSVTDTVALVNSSDWMEAGSPDQLYLELPYLGALEASLPQLDFRYVIAYDRQDRPILRAYFQLITVDDISGRFGQWLADKGPEQVMQRLLPSLKVRLMICGNVFLAGENGFDFNTLIDRNTAHSVLAEVIQEVSAQLEPQQKSALILIKELYPENDPGMDAFSKDKFYSFHIDTNMILALSPHWRDLEDYYECMTSKFRTKARSIWKRSAAIQSESWDAIQIGQQLERLDELHGQVLSKADFSVHELNAHSFMLLKEALGDRFEFKAYLLEEQLVGFSAALIGSDYVDAAHVGLDYTLNQEHGLYQRMLHEFVELAIQRGAKELRFGRTAEEMKSNLGARPVDMRVYIRHRNGLVNHLLKPVLQEIKPSSFRLRNPFKAEYTAEWLH